MSLARSPRPPVVRLPPKSSFELLLSRGSQVALICLGIVGLVFALEAGEFLLSPIALAISIGLMMGPVASAVERRGVPPVLSALLVVIIFLILMALFAMALVVPLGYWAGRLPQIWAQIKGQIADFQQPLEMLKTMREQIREVTGAEGMKVSVEDGGAMQSVATMAPAIGAQILLFFASLYFFVATRDQTRIAILRICFNRRLRWRVAHIFRDVEHLVSRYLLSITCINVGLAVAVTLGLWAAGVPQPAVWGALAGILNFIVYIGPVVMSAILFAVGVATYDSFPAAFVPMLVYLSINLIEAQFVTPTVIGRTMTLNPFVVFLALAFWIWVWGPIGGFIAIPMLLILLAIVRNIVPGLNWGTDNGRLERPTAEHPASAKREEASAKP